MTQLKKSRFHFGLGNNAFLNKNVFFFFKLVQNPYITVRSDGSLHIERVRLQDGGEYTCVASNVAGTINKTTTVDVHGKRHTLFHSFQTWVHIVKSKNSVPVVKTRRPLS